MPLSTEWMLNSQEHSVIPTELYSGGKSYALSERDFKPIAIGSEPAGLPLITHVQVIDFNGDGVTEILSCDASLSQITLDSQDALGNWTSKALIENVAAPAHATCVDIDLDNDLDIVVSILGNIYPDDSVVGRVELFEQTDSGFFRHVLLPDVRRVADVQPGDFDGDGDLDLAVAVFGYSRGEILWLENHGDFQFEDHLLLTAPGTIHLPVSDYDQDGDLDIAAIVSQDEEELWGFENDGQGQFTARRLWFSVNFDLGSAGLVQADLDQDGDTDLILPVGDNLEDYDAYPQPYHGCYWFENLGNWKFEEHRISDLGGTYAADVGDLDADGDFDVVLVSMTNNWQDPQNASVVWLENNGDQTFKTWQIATIPIHLVTVGLGDLNGDQKLDIVAGALNFRRPHERVGRVSAWIQKPEKVEN
ncbi:VCBS repeat-containing protein [uncultured Rubinisphaera sp.]|uniref:FG-GAP repeat domain-containing protein n=1 Tax=uncultured Rubinisphaera sp. TaxID=1678686 RepID=UPI0030D7DC7A